MTPGQRRKQNGAQSTQEDHATPEIRPGAAVSKKARIHTQELGRMLLTGRENGPKRQKGAKRHAPNNVPATKYSRDLYPHRLKMTASNPSTAMTFISSATEPGLPTMSNGLRPYAAGCRMTQTNLASVLCTAFTSNSDGMSASRPSSPWYLW